MVKTPTALLLGAGGSALLMESEFSDTVREYLRVLQTLAGRPTDTGNSKRGSESGLAAEIEGLKRMIRDGGNNRDVVIVNRGGGSGWGFLKYGLLVAGASYVYVRYWKGWRLGDLMYVSQATMKASTGAVMQGMEGLKEATAKAKQYLQGRIDVLEKSQSEHMEKTDRIDTKVGDLGGAVEDIHSDLSQVGDNVRGMQGQLGSLQDAQAYACQGIHLLLKVVGELTHHNELENFSKKNQYLPSSSNSGNHLALKGSEPQQSTPALRGSSSFSGAQPDVEDVTADGRLSSDPSSLGTNGRPRGSNFSKPALNRAQTIGLGRLSK